MDHINISCLRFAGPTLTALAACPFSAAKISDPRRQRTYLLYERPQVTA